MTATKKILGATLSACLSAGIASAEQYNANTYFPDNHALARLGLIDFAADLRERTGGEIDFKVFTSGTLVPPRASLSAIGDNIAQVGFFAGTYTPAELPVANLVASLAFENTDMLVQALASTEFSLTNEAQLAEWKDNRVVFGGGYSTPPYNLFCTVPIRTAEDMKGKRLRMPGGVYERWAQHLGAVSVNISSNEMYTGLERGALDCASNANDALVSHSLHEVVDHAVITENGVYYSGAMYGYNPGFWAGLKPEQRSTLFDGMATHIVRTTMGYAAEHEEALAFAREQGVEVVAPDESLRAATEEFIKADRAKLIEDARSAGIEGAAAIVEDYSRLVDKWETLLSGIDRDDQEAVAALLKQEVYDKLDAAGYGLD